MIRLALASALSLLIPSANLFAAGATADYQAIDQLGFAAITGAANTGAANAEAAVSELRQNLTSEEPQVRWRAARALGNLGERAEDAAPDLVKLLGDANPVVVVHASIALGRIGDNSPGTLEALIEKVTSKDERVARAALQTLQALEAPPEKLASALEEVLESDNAAVMSFAVDAVVRRGAEATPFLNSALGKEKAAYWAALAISEIGPPAAGTVPELVALLGRSDDAETLQLALVALAKIGPAAHEAAPAVTKVAAASDDAGNRIAACYALGAIGADSATALLKQLETSGGEFQAMAAAWALAKVHPDDPDAMDHALELVVAGLKNDRGEVRDAAAAGLLELEAPAGRAAPFLVEAVRTATPEQRAHLAMALAGLGPEVVEPAIRALPDKDLRGVAIEVLGRLGPEASGSVEALSDLLASDSSETVAKVQYALAAIGEEAGSAADRLAASLKSKSEEIRQSALFALRQIGLDAQPAADPLADFLESADSDFERYATAWALARMKLSATTLDRVTKTLNQALDSDDERVRLETITAIRDLGPAGNAFEAKLKQMAESDPSAEVRAAAAR